MKLTGIFLAMASLTLGAIAPVHGDCPNVRATDVPAKDVLLPPVDECSLTFHLFDIRIEIPGPNCYSTIIHYPAHHHCESAPNSGTMCAQASPLNVTRETCQCGVSIFGLHIGIPVCSCSAATLAGTIHDARTLECPMLTHP